MGRMNELSLEQPVAARTILTPQHINLADKVAALRFRQAVNRGVANADRNRRIDTYAEGLAFHQLGARAELAFVVYLGGTAAGVKWNSFVDGRIVNLRNLPDVEFRGFKFDVKGVGENHLSLCVPAGHVNPLWDYVLVGAEFHPSYVMMGWARGPVVLGVPVTEPRPKRPAHLIRVGSPLLQECKFS